MALRLNVGPHDRAIRVIIGILIIVALVVWEVNPRWLVLLGVIPILTAIGWCPIYEMLDLTSDTTIKPVKRRH